MLLFLCDRFIRDTIEVSFLTMRVTKNKARILEISNDPKEMKYLKIQFIFRYGCGVI